MTAPDGDTRSAGWTLIQLAETTRRAEELLLDVSMLLPPDAHGGMPGDAEIALRPREGERVSHALEEAAELTDRLGHLASQLPRGEFHAAYDEVRDAAAADLAAGILDPERALLAARLLDVRSGWPALARALRESDAAAAWGPITVAQLLGRFRGADRSLLERAVADAGLTPDVAFAACPPERLDRLADVLEAHSSRPRGA